MGRPPLLGAQRADVGYLHPHHRSMARAMVAGGLRPGELAALYKFTESQISTIIHSPLFKAEVARLEALAENNTINVRKELETLQPRAMEVLAEDLFCPDRSLRNKTAVTILNKTGYPDGVPIQKSVHLNLNAEIDPSRMEKEDLYREVMELVESDEGIYVEED